MVIHVIGFLAIAVLEHKIVKKKYIITKTGLLESLVSNVKTFEKYTSQLSLINDSNCSKNIRY